MTNKLHRKCPCCNKLRKWRVPEHMFAAGREWQKRDGIWVCYWCIARETPDGEEKLRELHKVLKQEKREFRKSLKKV